MNVPFSALDRQYRKHREAFIAIADCALSTGRALQGPEVEELERTLCQICRRRYAVAAGSCTDALAFALLSAGIGPDDEVIVTPFSFFASVSPILRVGARPRFADIDPDDYQMALPIPDHLVTKRTKAVIAVHLYGQTLPMKEVEAFARRHNLLLIEDAAQALGSFDGERPAGSMGDVSCLSFDPTKIIGSFSSAGALLTDDEDLCRLARSLRYHGRNPETRRYERIGFNSQVSTEMAAMLQFKVSHLPEWIRGREKIATLYRGGLSDVPGVSLPAVRPGSSHNWHKFVIRLRDRDALAAHLAGHGVETMIHYPCALCDEPVIKSLALPGDAVNTPQARAAAREVLSLPIYPELTEQEARYVVNSVRTFFNEKG